MNLESNGNVHNWKGFCFDIEGPPFTASNNYTQFSDAIAIWNKTFDYIANESVIRGKTIDMECVSVNSPALDIPLGTAFLEEDYGCPAYTPERFTKYAPMIYRCWYQGTRPFGSPMDPAKPWHTSYNLYSSLALLNASVPSAKLGVYLGISNCSCYGADLPQPEPITWGNATGFDDLVRDALIAKSFGIKEITFFLDWTAIENGYFMGGVFASYGIDFLQQMNYWVNVNPPANFTIYYRQSDAVGAGPLQQNWIFGVSQPLGIAEITGLWALATALVIIHRNMSTKRAMRPVDSKIGQ
jgi:hypothetical protein